MKTSERNFIGYGQNVPNPNWPKKARLAINFVINVEEGSEYSPLLGDEKSESGLSEVPGGRHKKNQRDLAIESIYEYGSRVGFWRITKLLDNYKMPHTFFVCALTLLQNKEICEHIKNSSNDICCHGYRWEEHYRLNKIIEIVQTRIKQLSGNLKIKQEPHVTNESDIVNYSSDSESDLELTDGSESEEDEEE
mgnify:CR=1 FL=1